MKSEKDEKSERTDEDSPMEKKSSRLSMSEKKIEVFSHVNNRVILPEAIK